MASDWIVLSLLSMLALSVVFLLFKRIGDVGVGSGALLLYYFSVCALFLLGHSVFNRLPLQVDLPVLGLILVSGLLGAVGNVLMIDAMKAAPNPGFALAIVGANTLLVTVASVFLFKSEFTLVKGIGALLAVLGVVLLGL